MDERVPVSEHTADSMIEGLHRPEALILADPEDSEPARRAWDRLSAVARPAGTA
jgi:hypothetical protein